MCENYSIIQLPMTDEHQRGLFPESRPLMCLRVCENTEKYYGTWENQANEWLSHSTPEKGFCSTENGFRPGSFRDRMHSTLGPNHGCSWGREFKLNQGHKSANQAVLVVGLHWGIAKAIQRCKGDKCCRYEAGLLNSGGFKKHFKTLSPTTHNQIT